MKFHFENTWSKVKNQDFVLIFENILKSASRNVSIKPLWNVVVAIASRISENSSYGKSIICESWMRLFHWKRKVLESANNCIFTSAWSQPKAWHSTCSCFAISLRGMLAIAQCWHVKGVSKHSKSTWFYKNIKYIVLLKRK